MTRVLYLYGGWPGHRPYEVAGWAHRLMFELDFDAEDITDLHLLDQDARGRPRACGDPGHR
jgi:uncharacterized protein